MQDFSRFGRFIGRTRMGGGGAFRGGGGGYGGGGFGGGGPTQMSFGPGMTPVVRAFIMACAAVYVLQILAPQVMIYFALIPAQFFSGYIWQLVSFNFLHGPLMHILMNLFMIWMFGSEIEMMMGRRRFIILMAVSGMGAGFCQALFSVLGGGPEAQIPIIGASGIVFGLLLVYGMTWPNRQVLVMFIIPMRVKWMVVIFGVIEFLAVVGDRQPGVAHLAHLGGMLFAYIFVRYDKVYMRLRRAYYERKLKRYRSRFSVHEGGKKDRDDGPTVH
ncbi:MAG: rhomboid family intramembrane serine protease [Deltaproteobacteria bacterium]|nr:rhomboid family intramembrane serine protease [Deltaproteobacteria bacterium]